MRKKILIIIVWIFIMVVATIILTFMFAKNHLNVDIQEKQKQIINNIGTSRENYFVYNKDNQYFVYNISGNSYVCDFYKIHKNEKAYNKYKEDYRGNLKANLFYDDGALLTKIRVSSGVVEDGFIESLESKHKGFKKL